MNFILLFRLLFFKFLLINHLVNCGIGIDKPHVGGQENQKTQFLKQGSNKRKNLPEEATNHKGQSSLVTSVHYEDNFPQSEKNDYKIAEYDNSGIAEDRINKMVEELQNEIKEVKSQN
uniref:Uncharacterized protein n=1 Tax=Meloidogyne hapla TaxID=6305 RepID=A0A1I8B732_MELHA